MARHPAAQHIQIVAASWKYFHSCPISKSFRGHSNLICLTLESNRNPRCLFYSLFTLLLPPWPKIVLAKCPQHELSVMWAVHNLAFNHLCRTPLQQRSGCDFSNFPLCWNSDQLCGVFPSQSIFFFFMNYYSCVEKRWSKRRLMRVRVKGYVPATFHSWPISRKGLLLPGLTVRHLASLKNEASFDENKNETFHIWQRRPSPLRCKCISPF